MDSKEIEKKWQQQWEEAKLFEANPDPAKKKYFVTFPYPYMNGYMHIGHSYTLMRVEAMARFKRMQGYNVLFPQGWHCTGSPITSAAQRIAEGEEKQIKIMKDMGFSDAEIKKFAKPEHWAEFFPNEAKKDMKRFGISIDFRREFITTSLNPHYDRFIRWQFNKLKARGYVVKGRHPVVWCPKEGKPIGIMIGLKERVKHLRNLYS
jgi:leucyl-tRNA synthetase